MQDSGWRKNRCIPCSLHPPSSILYTSLRRLRAFAQHRAQLFEEIVHVVELAINACEPHKRYRIQIPQVSHHDLTELAAFDFAVEVLIDIVLDGGRRHLDLPRGDRPLPAGPFQAALDLLALEWHARAVFLDDFDRRLFRPLVGREPPVAAVAFAAPPNGQTILTGARIDYLVVVEPTERTFHIRITIHCRRASYSDLKR